MDFTYDDEQIALRDAVRGLLARKYSDFEQRRRQVAEDPGFDESLWGELAEMGVLGLPFSEDDGGMGAGPVEVAIVATELGRVIAPEPFLSSVVLAGGLVALAGTPEQRTEVLGSLASGERVLALAHLEPGDPVTATPSGDSWTLSGVKEPVVHGARADQVVVSATRPDGSLGLFLVEGDAATRAGYSSYDGGRAARISFEDTTAVALGDPETDGAPLLEQALAGARIAACHEMLGGMEVALSATTDYLKSRKQFGVTLNTFQALNFRAADMYVSLELARSTALWASMVHATGDAAATREAAARAGLHVGKAARHIGQDAIQLHGGIAMTAEYLVGNITARLTVLERFLGDGDHLSVLAAGIDDHAALDPIPEPTA
ncbi:acyl-CoA dehydrogenase [Nocardioides seonyuensis]|uniref:Acyl-CoA dehydrogenase n=1 Tax=Nocardioides seonyuensis TaxID=2518371 RepID=A0A4P7IC86_9ACTN|nr:acyl-CoA dehydrogenase [Nocardioides seonyuensis]QBX54699.1 acyl-CoA dehydrogenase [Nocardioides seonyuensis]